MLDFKGLRSSFANLDKSTAILQHLSSKGTILTFRGNYDQVEIALENLDGTDECVLLRAITKAFEEYSATSLRKLTAALNKQVRSVM